MSEDNGFSDEQLEDAIRDALEAEAEEATEEENPEK